MKNLIITLFLVLPALAAAEYKPQPTDVILVMRDGKEIGRMSRKDYKVVAIEKDAQVIATRQEEKEYRAEHFSAILHAGIGKSGLQTGHNGTQHTVEEANAAVFGATLCRTFDTVGLCATGMSNKTFTLGIKKDF